MTGPATTAVTARFFPTSTAGIGVFRTNVINSQKYRFFGQP